MSIDGPVRVYLAEPSGKIPYRMVLIRAGGGTKVTLLDDRTMTQLALIHLPYRLKGSCRLPERIKEHNKLLREAKKWAYYHIYDPLELLAMEAPDW